MRWAVVPPRRGATRDERGQAAEGVVRLVAAVLAGPGLRSSLTTADLHRRTGDRSGGAAVGAAHLAADAVPALDDAAGRQQDRSDRGELDEAHGSPGIDLRSTSAPAAPRRRW
jgi:hypothetical protein